MAFAEENNLPFYDFNTEKIYNETGFIYDSADMNNTGTNPYLNTFGAKK